MKRVGAVSLQHAIENLQKNGQGDAPRMLHPPMGEGGGHHHTFHKGLLNLSQNKDPSKATFLVFKKFFPSVFKKIPPIRILQSCFSPFQDFILS